MSTLNLLAALLLPSLSHPASTAREEGPLRVVTTLGILQSMVNEVGGSHVQAEALLIPGQDPHFVKPRPTLMKRARAADLCVEIGLQLSPWVDLVVEGSGNARLSRGQTGRVVAATGIPTLELPSQVSREWGDVHPYGNPHIWLDPQNWIPMADNITAALIAVDPDHRGDYEAGRDQFASRVLRALYGETLPEKLGESKLQRLARRNLLLEYLEKKEMLQELGGWLQRAQSFQDTRVVSHHRTWGYFARRFGLTVLAQIEEKPGIPPSARHRDQLIDRMKKQGVRTLLVAYHYALTSADYVAKATQSRVLHLPIDLDPERGILTCFDLIDALLGELERASATDQRD
jgi:ABC-type Zn uptake system ZnuABC Zn-binding protein ZnuA